MKSFAVAVLVLLIAGALPDAVGHAQTAALDAADRAAIKRVIDDQIAAFRRDDGAAAFALASPGIQATFGTPEAFMGMVRQGYQPVYRPRQVRFGEVIMRDWGPEQRVFVVGPDGHPYIAVYPMERQADGKWKTNGCSLERPKSA
jgi:hypothetical protein